MAAGNTGWIRTRHKVVGFIVLPFLRIITKKKYNIDLEPFDGGKNSQYLILYNHQTPFDQFFISLSFKNHVYFLATEDIFSNGIVSSLLRFFVAPVPIKKHTLDIGSVKSCLRIAKEGGSLAIAPEGNRTYSGKTEYINPSIASLAKKLCIPVALYRIEGGYGKQPRWSDVIRGGKMHGFVSEVISAEEVKSLQKSELADRIINGLDVRENKSDSLYESDSKAEFLERAVYVCPKCGFAEFKSSGNKIQCLKCKRIVEYGADKRLKGQGFDFQFPYVAEWYDYQSNYVNSTDLTKLTVEPVFTDTADIYEVVLNKRKKLLKKNAAVKLFGDRMEIGFSDNPFALYFADAGGSAVLGRNKLNIECNGIVYQFKGNEHFNALKYLNFYNRYKNITGGNPDGKFLGL